MDVLTSVSDAKSVTAIKDKKNALENALKRNHSEERYAFQGWLEFLATQDHILQSLCRHIDGEICQVCRFEKGQNLAHLPEMIFPRNRLALFHKGRKFIEFNAFDALQRVDSAHLPGVKVGPSAVWQTSRQEQLLPLREFSQPFDWTYTSDYRGTLGDGIRVELADKEAVINYEKLKRKDPIQFYSQIPLYEDELADHGCAQMMVRVRVMPDIFFVLCRLYLRVDHVIVRICDTRLYGEAENDKFCIREWSQREASYSQLSKEALDSVLDPNLLFAHLPLSASQAEKIFYPCC